MLTWLHRHGVALRPFFRLGSERDYASSISLGAGGEPDNSKAMGVDRDPRGTPGSRGPPAEDEGVRCRTCQWTKKYA